jgi:hypothetical protein
MKEGMREREHAASLAIIQILSISAHLTHFIGSSAIHRPSDLITHQAPTPGQVSYTPTIEENFNDTI